VVESGHEKGADAPLGGKAAEGDGPTRAGQGEGGVEAVKRFVSRYVPLLWLLAVLSLVGWFIWNGDLAGWILLALVIGLMAWQLAGREGRPRRPGANGRGVRDESAP
jgi:hypothetical protein